VIFSLSVSVPGQR